MTNQARKPNHSIIAIGSVADLCGFRNSAALIAFMSREGLETFLHNRGFIYRSGLFAIMATRRANLRNSGK